MQLAEQARDEGRRSKERRGPNQASSVAREVAGTLTGLLGTLKIS